MGFQVPEDIANRALQHCGLPRLDPILGFGDGTQRAAETQFAYGKIKQAELERNVWQFSRKSACLRPIDNDTMILAPTLWQQGITYFLGSIVSDANSFLWRSRIPNNTSNQPGTIYSAWEPYFGPLTAQLYCGTTDYFAGEVVYTAPGDGSYNVYLSLVSGNALDPSLPNIWSESQTYNLNQVVQTFPNWSSGTSYSAGSTVLYTDGNYYSSLTNSNLDNIPASTVGTEWALMPTLIITPSGYTVAVGQTELVSTTISPVNEWSAAAVYAIGSYVMFDGNEYVSLVANNTGNAPNAANSTSWAQVSGGTLWMSLFNLNSNNNPTSTPAAWSSATTYSSGNVVAASDGFNYTATSASGNLDQNPANGANPTYWTQDKATAWTSTFTQGGGNQQWLQIGGSAFPAGVGLALPDIVYPLGAGPASDSDTKNIYMLPAAWLREAAQDPKAGSTSWLGAPSGLPYNDWEYGDRYFVSRDSEPIVYWFAADVTDVSLFSPMFCETLGYHIALGVVEILTQSASKKQIIAGEFEKFGGEARIVNGMGMGATEPAEDDFVTCRL